MKLKHAELMCSKKPLQNEGEMKVVPQDVNTVRVDQLTKLKQTNLKDFVVDLDRKLMEADGGWTDNLGPFTEALGIGPITMNTPLLDVHLTPTIPSVDGFRGIKLLPPVTSGMIFPGDERTLSFYNWSLQQRAFWTRVCLV